MTKGQYAMDLTGKWLCERTAAYNGWYAKETEGEYAHTDLDVRRDDGEGHMFVEVKFRQNDSQKYSTFYFPYNKWKLLTDNPPDAPVYVYYAWKDKYTVFPLDFVSKYQTGWHRGEMNQATLKEGPILSFIIPVSDVRLYDYSQEQLKIIDIYNATAAGMSNEEWKKEIDVKRL